MSFEAKFTQAEELIEYARAQLSAHGRLPSNGQLAQRFKVSMGTVAGIIFRAQHRGVLPMRKKVDPTNPLTIRVRTKLNVPLWEVRPMGCKYPTSETPGVPNRHLFCNANRKALSPYCDKHHVMCYAGVNPIPRRRKKVG